MVKIHGAAFIIIGFVVAVTSFFIKDLRVFMYVGLGFVLWGLLKLLYIRLTNEKPDIKKEHKITHPTHTKPIYHRPQQTHSQPQYRHCPNCRSAVRIENTFCPRCGTRLKY